MDVLRHYIEHEKMLTATPAYSHPMPGRYIENPRVSADFCDLSDSFWMRKWQHRKIILGRL